MKHTAKLVMVTAASLIIGIASISSAQDNSRSVSPRGKMYSRYHQKGMCNFRGGRGMFPAANTLSDEQINKLKTLKTEFRNATLDLRQELRSKRLALESELAKSEPDAKTARALQKDISALNTELGQKRIEHVLEMKKIAPYGHMGQLDNGRERLKGRRLRQM